MKQVHYKSMLSAFVNHELAKSDQQIVAEHLMQCSDCRREHDRIKLGSALGSRLERADSPERVWNSIASELDGKRSPQMSLIPQSSFFNLRNLAAYSVGILLVAGLATAVYLTLIRETPYQARTQNPPNPQAQTGLASDVANVPNGLETIAEQTAANAAVPSNNSVSREIQTPETAPTKAWEFAALSGTPSVGSASSTNRLAVGDFLETDAASRARITVADIGNVEIQPNSRVKLVGTTAKEHRLSLEHGVLEAQIFAPPRLFIVDTPSAVAVDLGCAYKLEVDKAGNSYLHVTSGFVALERGERESIVPAGAMCITKRGKGLGTPFSAETTAAFRSALERFDFAAGGSRAVTDLLEKRNPYDIITLWHLLSRVSKSDREKVFDALAAYVTPPEGVTRQGILGLDKTMLADWRNEVESAWFGQ